jgi:hypothetical protein
LNLIDLDLPVWLDILRKYGIWAIIVIFLVRAIGDFRYVGFFKKYRNTKFGKNDTKYYSPLCLLIGILGIMIIVI